MLIKQYIIVFIAFKLLQNVYLNYLICFHVFNFPDFSDKLPIRNRDLLTFSGVVKHYIFYIKY